MMDTYPDWAPSVRLGHTEMKQTDTARSARRTKRGERKSTLQSAEDGREQRADKKRHEVEDGERHTEEDRHNEEMTHEVEDGDRHTEDERHTEEMTHEVEDSDRHTEVDETQTKCKLCMVRFVEVNRLLEENRQLRCELDKHRMSQGFFKNDDKVKYYTGLPNLGTFMALLNFLVALMPDQNKILSPFQMMLLTFMRLKLDLPAQHWAYLFHVSPKTVYRTFNEMVSFLHANLKRFIVWPDRETLHKIIPHQFVQSFGHKVAVIIDCFEIFTEKPSNLKHVHKCFPVISTITQ